MLSIQEEATTAQEAQQAIIRALADRVDPELLDLLPRIAGAATPEETAAFLVLMATLRPPHSEDIPALAALNAALRDVWGELNPVTARAYARAVLPPAGKMRREKPWRIPVGEKPRALERRQIGPYLADRLLGYGASGQAISGRHVETGRQATLKVGAAGELLSYGWLGDSLPSSFLRLYEHGSDDTPYGVVSWMAREPAKETWRDFMARRRGGPVGRNEALSLFAIACQGVAALHERRVYQWSAHAGNLFLTAEGWKAGDLGRCSLATSPDDPRLVGCFSLDGWPPVMRSKFLDSFSSGPWDGTTTTCIFPRNPDREYRLRLDDCASLGGLLLDLLGLNRWQAFYQAIRTRPYCSRVYRLTGEKRTDDRLSAAINRAWLGDAGGALAVANGLDIDGYADPLELLADVQAAFR